MNENSTDQTKQELLRQELSKLVSAGGVLRPEDIVAAARSKSSPLHPYFEWDDSAAAAAYRLIQAAALIRYVKISVETKSDKVVIVRMFESLPSDRGDDTGYRTIHSIMNDEMKREELLKTALCELEAFRIRYRHLCEFAGLMREIERTSEALRAPARRAKEGAPRGKTGSGKRPLSRPRVHR